MAEARPAVNARVFEEWLVESLGSVRRGAAQEAWLALAKRRRDELRSGQVAGIPGEEGSALVRRLVGR